MDKHIAPVELEKAYRLLNHGPTVLVSATHEGVDNVMAAAWSCALDFSPPKVTVVLDKRPKRASSWSAAATSRCKFPTWAKSS